MDKDALSSIGLIGLLLVIILVALFFTKRQEVVEVSRPSSNEIISQTLDFLGLTTTGEVAGEATTCPVGCVPEETPAPTLTQREQWRQDPVPYVREQLAEQFAPQTAKQELAFTYIPYTDLWWRSDDEQYRLKVGGAKLIGVQVQTTDEALTMVPRSDSATHPAMQHPALKKVEAAIAKQMKDLGYKKSAFAQCPLSESYDPFDNCVANYARDEQRCTVMAGYGRVDGLQTDIPYLRLELACSGNYQAAYDQAAPYLYAVKMINPEWRVPDMAVHEVKRYENFTRVDFGLTYAYFQTIDSGLRLVGSNIDDPDCEVVGGSSNKSAATLSCR